MRFLPAGWHEFRFQRFRLQIVFANDSRNMRSDTRIIADNDFLRLFTIHLTRAIEISFIDAPILDAAFYRLQARRW